ncbi:cellulose synthase-like protein H1 isoform X2 [Castanea sativa]|uniref:cellulose synthase-like protein H1 isoform X2 n=1 Tax=Castanea sativa TaxID=21020 RepID=UPI003F64BB5C
MLYQIQDSNIYQIFNNADEDVKLKSHWNSFLFLFMANATTSLPLFEKIPRKNTIQRGFDIIIFFLLLLLLVYRLYFLNHYGFTWILAFLCESWFTFTWVLVISTKWTLVDYNTYPDRLLQRVPEVELPSVDMFVTTADPVLEPPIITVNTVLSLLAVDYPSHKLACYVSDDGCSPLTYYSLVEASKFAKLWVPFCNKYNVQVRAPFRYFSGDDFTKFSGSDTSSNFQQEWKRMKDEYEQLCVKIEDAVQNQNIVPCDLTAFSEIDSKNHPTILKVIWENKEGLLDGLPGLVYLSREKRPNHSHRYKAGAMNVLTRVSGLMTNAPYMLNVDCDMYANNPKIVLHAMCLLLGSNSEKEIAFVQFSNAFYDGLKDDPYGNQLVVLLEYMACGFSGLQGFFYGGTGCFHRRKVIYGLQLDNIDSVNEEILKRVGSSKELMKSVAHALKGKTNSPDLSNSIDTAYQVAGCGYEHGTSWGRQVQEQAFYIAIVVFVIYHLYTLSEYLRAGLSVRSWWNNQRMARITTMTAWFFGFLIVILKLLRISETVFEITKKDKSTSSNGAHDVDAGRFTFDESPIFVPGTTILMVHLTALVVSLLNLQPPAHDGLGSGLGEVLCSVWLVLCFWPFLKGLFGKGKHGIPLFTICKSAALVLLFLHLCRMTAMG